jgi:tRNA dimethylallyltransferase
LGEKNIPEVPPNPDLRKKLESKTAEQLFAILKKMDPRRAKNIDAKNPRRLIRAIEICEALGRVPKIEIQDKKYETLKIGIAPITPSPTPSSYNKRKGLPEPSFVVREGGVSYILDELELKNRINKRIDKWFKQGLLQEVTNLHKKGLSWKRMSEIGLEYRLVAKYLNSNYTTPKVSKGTFDTSGLKERMQIETYQYAKRQMTWFKKDPSIVWFTPDSNKSLPTDLIQKQIEKFLNHDNF